MYATEGEDQMKKTRQNMKNTLLFSSVTNVFKVLVA